MRAMSFIVTLQRSARTPAMSEPSRQVVVDAVPAQLLLEPHRRCRLVDDGELEPGDLGEVAQGVAAERLRVHRVVRPACHEPGLYRGGEVRLWAPGRMGNGEFGKL